MKELREDRRPADLWYWSDWFSSFDVRSCSLAARGLWADMLGIMSKAEVKGTLAINGKPLVSKTLAKIVGAPPDEVERLLIELEFYEVFSRLEDGTIINRRMYRSGELSRKRAEAGRIGGAKSKQNDSKDDSKDEATLESEDEDSLLLSLKEKWNTLAEAAGLPQIKDITKGSKRARAVHARLADKSFDIDALLDEVKRAPFLLGRKTDFKATFDWIIAPSNYQKIIEGNYRGQTPIDGARRWLESQEKKDAK